MSNDRTYNRRFNITGWTEDSHLPDSNDNSHPLTKSWIVKNKYQEESIPWLVDRILNNRKKICIVSNGSFHPEYR